MRAVKIGLHTKHCCPLRILWEVAFTGTMIFYFITGYILLANHGVKIEDLTRVLSHPQCEHTLTRLRVAREVVDDIAGAERMSNAEIYHNSYKWPFVGMIPAALVNVHRLHEYATEVLACSSVEDGLLPVLEDVSRQGVELDLQDIFQRFTFDTICKLLFDYDPQSMSPDFPDIPCEKALCKMEEAILFRQYNFSPQALDIATTTSSGNRENEETALAVLSRGFFYLLAKNPIVEDVDFGGNQARHEERARGRFATEDSQEMKIVNIGKEEQFKTSVPKVVSDKKPLEEDQVWTRAECKTDSIERRHQISSKENRLRKTLIQATSK
ncbi:alkane hydroxylase MAH1-like protein [Tanacetum coccineum]